MKKLISPLLAALCLSAVSCTETKEEAPKDLPSAETTLDAMTRANHYFMEKYKNPGDDIVGRKTWPSNIWTRGVYYEGLMALYSVDPKQEYYQYAIDWSEAHEWNFRDGITTRNADNQCAGQTYIDLFRIDGDTSYIANTKASIDSMMATDKIDDWDWIDAIQMGMPVFAKLGTIYSDTSYYNRMREMYLESRNVIGGGLYNEEDDLWWRDADYVPPYTEPNGEDCYWSRGNGWVVAALVKVLEELPEGHADRQLYLTDLKKMSAALLKIQRKDGFWNASLHDSTNYGGKETTGTSLFLYGMAWGMNQGVLDSATYMPAVKLGWNALLDDAVHENGFLGYVQSTGKEPSTGMPLSYDKIPDFEDYGLGCFLLAGSEIYKLAKD